MTYDSELRSLLLTMSEVDLVMASSPYFLVGRSVRLDFPPKANDEATSLIL